MNITSISNIKNNDEDGSIFSLSKEEKSNMKIKTIDPEDFKRFCKDIENKLCFNK
jgi:uncharacterized protein YlaN (UPF0358 family)